MLGGIRFRTWVVMVVPLILAACNLPDEGGPTDTPTPQPLSLEEIEAAVVASLVAEEEMTAAAMPTETPVPTATPSRTAAGPTETPTEMPSCLVVSNALNLRYGPGLAYAPPIQTLSAGQALLPFAKNADGSWLEVQLQGELTTGWVSSGAQFVSCNFDPLGLPLGQIPPTPIPTITPTPAPTFTPSPTDKPTSEPPTNTPCPKFTNATLSATVDAGTNAVSLAWGTTGGCGPYEGTLTATYKGDSSPYATYGIKAASGKLTETPPVRCEGRFTIVYTLIIKDDSGQSVAANTSADVTWIC